MANIFGGGFRIEPNAQSIIEHDYWEEFTRVNSTFSHEPDIAVRKIKKSNQEKSTDKKSSNSASKIKNSIFSAKNKLASVYPRLATVESDSNGKSTNIEDKEEGIEDGNVDIEGFRSIGVQTDVIDDIDKELPYWFCFCCRSTTPCVVWLFVAISIIFFKMGAIVTGRWIYLSSSSFDEVVFYIAFSVCLGFATLYFRRGTKYHNPFDLLFLLLTVPIMWALLTFTTTFLKKDIFFYVGSVIYSGFIIPYSAIGSYITYKFWTTGKLFLRRVEGDKLLEPFCKKLFLTQSLIMFDTQITICAGIISMAPSLNHQNTFVWISSLVFAPISIFTSVVALIIGYFAIRKEHRILTIIFTALCSNQFILVICMLLKRPTSEGAYYVFISAAIAFWTAALLAVHIGLLVILWYHVVPAYGKGLKDPVRRTSQNTCIQCTGLTICR